MVVAVLVRDRVHGRARTVTTVVRYLVATMFLALAGRGPRSWTGSGSGSDILAAVMAGMLGSAIAFVFYNAALAKVSTPIAATSLALIPVFGVALSAVFLTNPITATTLLASALVLAGVALSAHADTPAGPDTLSEGTLPHGGRRTRREA